MLGVTVVTTSAPEDPDERVSAYLAVIMAAVQQHIARRRGRHDELITMTWRRATGFLARARTEFDPTVRVAPPPGPDVLGPWFGRSTT